MARQVYFDPFGSYTQGFNVGANQQQNLENNVRRARAQDYDFGVLQPLRTRAAERQDTLGQASLPFQIKSLPIGYEIGATNLYKNQYDAARQGAEDFNITAPLESIFQNHYGITTSPNQDGTVTFSMGGVPFQTMAHPSQQLSDSLNYAKLFNLQKFKADNSYRQAMLDYYGQLGAARRTAADAAYYGATNPTQSPYAGFDFIGGPGAQTNPAAAPNPLYYGPNGPATGYPPPYQSSLGDFGIQ